MLQGPDTSDTNIEEPYLGFTYLTNHALEQETESVGTFIISSPDTEDPIAFNIFELTNPQIAQFLTVPDKTFIRGRIMANSPLFGAVVPSNQAEHLIDTEFGDIDLNKATYEGFLPVAHYNIDGTYYMILTVNENRK